MVARLRSLLKAIFKRSAFEASMDAEMGEHLEEYTENLIQSGVPPDEARRRARLEFGSLERLKEECRQAKGLSWPDEFGRNLRYGARVLRKSPAFTAHALHPTVVFSARELLEFLFAKA